MTSSISIRFPTGSELSCREGGGIGGITRKEVHSLLDVVCGLIFTHRPIEIRASNIWKGPPLKIEADFEVKFYPD